MFGRLDTVDRMGRGCMRGRAALLDNLHLGRFYQNTGQNHLDFASFLAHLGWLQSKNEYKVNPATLWRARLCMARRAKKYTAWSVAHYFFLAKLLMPIANTEKWCDHWCTLLQINAARKIHEASGAQCCELLLSWKLDWSYLGVTNFSGTKFFRHSGGISSSMALKMNLSLVQSSPLWMTFAQSKTTTAIL